MLNELDSGIFDFFPDILGKHALPGIPNGLKVTLTIVIQSFSEDGFW